MRYAAVALSLLPGLVSAWAAPAYDGLNVIWSDTFAGPAGSAPSDLWNIALE